MSDQNTTLTTILDEKNVQELTTGFSDNFVIGKPSIVTEEINPSSIQNKKSKTKKTKDAELMIVKGPPIRKESIYALPPLPIEKQLPLEERFRRCQAVGHEIITESELYNLLQNCTNPVAYDGFEPSGRMHLAQGLLKSLNVNRLTSSGFTFLFWVADWFAFMNHKMGGSMERIQTVGKYFIEVWKASGMNMERVKFLWASEEFSRRGDEYWGRVLEITTHFNVSRINRCTQIMGREEGENHAVSQYLYPCMQCADIFFLGVDVCQLGHDQRKVNTLAREYAKDKNLRSPIVLSHKMMPGLLENQEKMSKSIPDSAIFMDDSPAEVKRKINKAFCPEGIVENNPCLAYYQDLIFPMLENIPLVLTRPEKFGGNLTYLTYQDLEKDFVAKRLHPGDLKTHLISFINSKLEPIHRHFEQDPEAKKLITLVKSYQITR